MAPHGLSILVYPEIHRTWTARALQHDLAAEGRTIDSAVDTLVKMVRAHIAYDCRHNRQPLAAFGAAPKLYWEAFTRGTRLPGPVVVDRVEDGAAGPMVVNVVPRHPAIRIVPSAPAAARTA